MPVQTREQARTHATFNALMWAFAYPGRVQDLSLEPPDEALRCIADALLDLEVSACSTAPSFETVLRATGARVTALERAEYIFAPSLEPEMLARLRGAMRGDPVRPDRGATLVIGAGLSGGSRLRLSGPGVQSSLEVCAEVPLEFWHLRESVGAYPLGWDVLLTDGRGVLGVPRTTRIEVL